MRQAHFLNRSDELSMLDRLWSSTQSELVVLHGRRRVGKTELLATFAEDKPGVYLEALDMRAPDQLRDLAIELGEVLEAPDYAPIELADWPRALDVIRRRAESGPFLVVLDEYQHLARQSPELGSLISRWWREHRRSMQLTLVLAGSDVSFFADDVLGANAPLHGRRTAELQLRPFDCVQTGLFTPSWSAEDRIRAFSIWGGMPYYLDFLDERRDLATNIFETLLHPHAPLTREAEHLVRLESSLRDTAMYGSVLRAIADGAGTVSRIADRIGPGTDHGNLSRQLARLEAVGLVRREAPVIHATARTTRIELADNLLRFWYTFVAPAGARIATADRARRYLQDRIRPALDHFVSKPSFEEQAAHHIRVATDAADAGRWWGSLTTNADGEARTVKREVDAVSVDGDGQVVAVGTCKWTRARVTRTEVLRTIEVARHLAPDRVVPIFVYSRSGVARSVGPFVDDHPIHDVMPEQMLAR